MITAKLVACLVLTAKLGTQSLLPSKPPALIPAQDIDSYEKAGPYERVRLPNGKLPDDQIARIGKTREWFWSHWRERRRALLMEIFYSIEGDRSTFNYFVEPDQEGRWRIGIKIERLLYDHRFENEGCERFVVEKFTSYDLTRVAPEPDENGVDRPIAPDEKRAAGDYRIRMKLEETENFLYY